MAANCLQLHSMDRKTRKVQHSGAQRSKIGVRRRESNLPRVPPGKIVQAQAMLVEGRSQREIGRTLRISPMTVKKILKSEDFQTLIQEQQQRIFRKIPAVVDSVIAAAISDPYLGYQLLKDFSVIPERGTLFQSDPKNMATTTEEKRQEREIRQIAAAIEKRNREFEAAEKKASD